MIFDEWWKENYEHIYPYKVYPEIRDIAYHVWVAAKEDKLKEGEQHES